MGKRTCPHAKMDAVRAFAGIRALVEAVTRDSEDAAVASARSNVVCRAAISEPNSASMSGH